MLLLVHFEMAASLDYSMGGSYGRGGPLPHHRHIVPAVLGLLPAGQRLRVLDVGCGNGHIADTLTALGHDVVGIDFDANALDIARRTHPHLTLFLHEAERSFSSYVPNADLVIAVEVIEHIYSPQKFLHNVYGALRPGGHVILSTPYHGYWKNLAVSVLGRWDHLFTVDWEGGHIKFFSKPTLAKMLEDAGFEDIVFHNAGRAPGLWKSLVVRARKPER